MRSLITNVPWPLACIAILIASCKPTIPNQTNTDSVEQLVNQKLGNYEAYLSSSGTYTLFVQKIDPSAASPVTKFLVVESTSKKIILEKSFMPGYAKWIDNSTLEYLDAPGLLKQNETLSHYIKKIDLATLKK